MTTQEKLLKLKELVEMQAVVYKATEVWAKNYRKDPKSFERLLRMEARTERKMKSYFKSLSTRVPDWIDWHEYMLQVLKVKKAAVTTKVVVNAGKDEIQVLVTLLYSEIVDGMTSGAEAGAAANVAKIISQDTISSLVNKAAMDHAGDLAKGLTDTTLSRVKDSISISMANGDTVAEATARLSGFISGESNIPGMSRAEMIARTESVRAYNSGRFEFGKQAGAKTKTWIAYVGACGICSGLDGETVDYLDQFSDGNDIPPDHVLCKCGYEDGY